MQEHTVLDFDKLLALENLKIWDYEKTQCIGMGDDFRAVFRAILRDLQKLHDKNQFNGRLKESLAIHFESNAMNRFEVEFTGKMNSGGRLEFGKKRKGRKPSPAQISLAGLKRDFTDFNNLVSEATAALPEENKPDSLKLYFDTHFQKLLFSDLRESRHFIYFNPLFYNSADRNRLYHKACELGRRHEKAFYTHVTLTSSETSMNQWHDKLIGNQTPLWHIFNYQNNSTRYGRPAGIIRYLRNVGHHYQDYSCATLSSVVSEELYRLFPDACPKIFFEIVKNFRGDHGNYYFSIRLVDFLKDGPYGFPG